MRYREGGWTVWQLLGAWLIVAGIVAIAASITHAGEIEIRWPAPTDPRATAVRVFHGAGTVDDTPAFSPFDVPIPATTAVVTGLEDCTEYHISIKLVGISADGTELVSDWPKVKDADGNPTSENAIIRGWPRIDYDEVTFDAGGIMRITGSNFGPEVIAVLVDGQAVEPTSVDCHEIVVPSTAGSVVTVRALQQDGTTIIGRFDVKLRALSWIERTDTTTPHEPEAVP